MSYLYDYDDANQLQEIFSGTFQSRDEGDFTTSVETFAYDDDGNMIESDDGANTNTFSWDTFDRLVAVEKQPADETVLQYYDIGGLRKLKTAADGTETRSHFSGLPTVSEVETPSAGSPVEISYFMGHQLLGFDRGGDFRFFLTDGLSSVRVVVDGADGSQLAYYEYDEFGQQIAYSGSVVSPKTYVGGLGVHDDTADTGLLYMRARHYDPATARFLSRDPIGFAGGLNLYGYVGGNPVNAVDPEGLDVTVTLKGGFQRTFQYNELARLGPYLRSRAGRITDIDVVGHSGPTMAGADRRADHEAGLWIDYKGDWGDVGRVYVFWEKNPARDPKKTPAEYGYYDISDLKFPNLEAVHLRGCNTAGGHPEPEAMKQKYPDYAKAFHEPPTGDNIARLLSNFFRGAAVTGNKGPYYWDSAGKPIGGERGIPPHLPATYRNGASIP